MPLSPTTAMSSQSSTCVMRRRCGSPCSDPTRSSQMLRFSTAAAAEKVFVIHNRAVLLPVEVLQPLSLRYAVLPVSVASHFLQ